MNENEKEALRRWCDSAKEIEKNSFFDGCGNICSTRILKKKGRFYKVEFFMAAPCSDPVEVVPKKKKITITEWKEECHESR